MSQATVQRNDHTLVFAGVLDRAAAQVLWPATLRALAGTQRLDLTGVARVDSAGLALLVAAAARMRAASATTIAIEGAPAGLSDLCAAYRLSDMLDYILPSPPAESVA